MKTQNTDLSNSLRQFKNTEYAARVLQKSHERLNGTFTIKDAKGTNILNETERLVNLQAPVDLRFETAMKIITDFRMTDKPFMQDVFRGMRLHTSKKNYKEGVIETDVFFMSNMAAFEKYNTTIIAHNDQWCNDGRNRTHFDPRTGTMSPIHDTFIDPAVPDSPYVDLPKHYFVNMSDGPLAQAAPKALRNRMATIKWAPKLVGDGFELQYMIVNNKGKALYYNVSKGPDLAQLIRGARQEMWGHPWIDGDYGPILDGISLLMSGKKTHLARKNPRPTLLGKATLGNPLITNAVSTLGEGFVRVMAAVIGILVPILLFIGIFLRIGMAFREYSSENFVRDMGILCLAMVLCIWMSRILHGWSEANQLKRKLT